ncbi:hypothetical protein JHU04_003561 [Brenneria sp. 4F2]|nr:hypothetical protein [Brenneria bubanii]
MTFSWFKRVAESLRCRINTLTVSEPLDVTPMDDAGVSEVILSMGYLYGIETGSVYLVSTRTE